MKKKKTNKNLKQGIKHYCKNNIRIQITDVQLMDISFYGCDAGFHFEIRDKETDVLLDTDYDSVVCAFPGVDEDEEINCFLEGKGIDFYEEYDGDFDNIPKDLQEEYEDYLLQSYNEYYQEMFYIGELYLDECIEKIMRQLDLDNNLLYLVRGENVAWITVKRKPYPFCHVIVLYSNDLTMKNAYNLANERWLVEAEGHYFQVIDDGCEGLYLRLYKRREDYKVIVTEDNYNKKDLPGYDGEIGITLYYYDLIHTIPMGKYYYCYDNN